MRSWRTGLALKFSRLPKIGLRREWFPIGKNDLCVPLESEPAVFPDLPMTENDDPEWLKSLECYQPELDKKFAMHLAESHISYAEYSKMKRHQLGTEVMLKKRIYLDQKYWIYCRDAKCGRPQHPIHTEIWHLLQTLVNSGQFVCPVSYPVYNETFKQADSQRRMQLAETIDILSLGVALQPFPSLIQIELFHLLSSLSGTKLPSRNHMVWLPLGFVCGELVPHNTVFDAKTESAIQKAMYDTLAVCKFSMMVAAFQAAGHDLSMDDSAFQKQQTLRAELHETEFNSFKEVFMIEIAGALDAMRAEIDDVLKQTFEQRAKQTMFVSREDSDSGIKQLHNLLYKAYELEKLSTEFPSLHIGAGIHAAIRHQHRKYNKGDLDDHFHAKAALPYCNFFFTERILGTLLRSKPLEFDKQYACEVLWGDEEILNRLKRL